MSRRIRPWLSASRRFSRLVPKAAARIATAAAIAVALGAGLIGCQQNDAPRNANGTRMNRDEMLVHGDDMKMEGLNLKRHGETIGDDDMVRRGDLLISQGQQLIDKANDMPKQEQ